MSFLSDINISKKLSRIILIISGTALLIASTAFISLEIISYRKTLVDRISVLSEFIGINSAIALSSNDANKAELILQSLMAEESIDYAVIYTPHGEEFASYKIKPSIAKLHKGHDHHWMHKTLPTEAQFLFVANGLHVFKPILLNNAPIGYLSIFSNLQALYEQIFTILSFTGLILLLTLLSVHYLSRSLQRRVSVPIQNLVDGMQQVSEQKDFSLRLSPGEQDEIGFLIDRFNTMLGQIEDRDTKLENYREDLEQKIKERTASLAKVKESEQRIRQLAYSDELTGLASRTYLHKYLQDVINSSHRRNERFALLFLDLDGFKYVNDSLGHDVGDLLLKKIAQRLQSLLREIDFVARLSGDEFCIIIDKISDQYDAAYVANRCLQEMNEAIHLGGQEIRPRCSIGIAYYPDDGQDIKALLKAADSAMYAAKETGKHRYVFYQPEFTEKAAHRLQIEQDLRLTIEKQQLELFYQPQIDVKTGRMVGVEALIRWNHPVRGLISPLEFIDIAERIGFIKPLGIWVINSACQQAMEWRKMGLPHMQMAVNISPSHFQSPDIIDTVEQALKDSGFPAPSLELEVTESVIQTTANNLSIFTRLQEMGIKIAIDDFGTGYSSLASLKQLPIDCLKIDRLFIIDMLQDTNSSILLGTIVGVAHALGHSVVAEGVEEEEQVKVLRGIGCDIIQGYIFSQPVPANKIPELAQTDFLTKIQPIKNAIQSA